MYNLYCGVLLDEQRGKLDEMRGEEKAYLEWSFPDCDMFRGRREGKRRE